MQRLTSEFNHATVRKGETFEVELRTFGESPTFWRNVEVTTGKASLVGIQEGPYQCGSYFRRQFKADAKGNIEITATGDFGEQHAKQIEIFKVRVI